MDVINMAVVSASALGAIGTASWAGLRAWNGWLDLKRMELTQIVGNRGVPQASGRIEVADLRERVRKLEAIAEGIDI